METNAGGATVSVVEPTTEPRVALMLVLPCANVVASPVALIVAIAGCEDPHVTEVVKSFVLPSEYVPAAVNCCCNPFAILGFWGDTAMDTSVGIVTTVIQANCVAAPLSTLIETASPALRVTLWYPQLPRKVFGMVGPSGLPLKRLAFDGVLPFGTIFVFMVRVPPELFQ